MFADKSLLQKRYRAIVFGSIKENAGTITEAVDGTPSLSKYSVVTRTPVPPSLHFPAGGHITTVDLWPISGRTHQLRKHMLHLGHPIVGDHRYASTYSQKGAKKQRYDYFEEGSAAHSRLCLHALQVTFVHPFLQGGVSYDVVIPEPEEYERVRKEMGGGQGGEGERKRMRGGGEEDGRGREVGREEGDA